MKQLFFSLIGALIAASMLSSCGGKPVLKPSSKDTDSLSYAIGVHFGSQLKGSKLENLDARMMAQAIIDAMSEDSTVNPQMTTEQAGMYINAYFIRMQEKEYEPNKLEGEKFLQENKSKEGVVTLPSGLQYKVVTPGTGAKPTEADTVMVYYKGMLIDGKEFDSHTAEKGEPVKFGLGDVIRGWGEGMLEMNEGGKYLLYVPQEMAYGQRGAGGMIKPFSALIFEVELVKVLPAKTEAK